MASTNLALLNTLHAVADHCQIVARNFNDEQADEVLAVCDQLRALFLPPSAPALTPDDSLLLQLPSELLSVILSNLDTRDLARLTYTCRSLLYDPPAPLPPPRAIGPVEMELRQRAETRGLHIGSSLPDGALSWAPYLLKAGLRDELRRQTPLAVETFAMGPGPESGNHNIFVDREGRLLTCGVDLHSGCLLGHAVDPDADLNASRTIGAPTPLPSMQDRRIVSVASGGEHCLALSAEGEVYSWGDERDLGLLGHGTRGARAVPSRIESLSCIDHIATGPFVSAAVDQGGRLFTWGMGLLLDMNLDVDGPLNGPVGNGLGYELETQTERQLTPKRVDALSHDRVVSVALGDGFSLAVTDAGAVFAFGSGWNRMPGHASSGSKVLPRRMDALDQTGRRFVAVAAGNIHALALTEDGELYGWEDECGSGHGRDLTTPTRVATLFGERFKLVGAGEVSSFAVTEKGELYTWGDSPLGHGGANIQPTRLRGLGGARVAAVAMTWSHVLVADEDGAVWAYGPGPQPKYYGYVDGPPVEPTLVAALRVRALKSP